MNATLGNPDDLQAEIYRLCDACVHEFESEDERIELEHLVQSRPEARELYLDFFLDSAALRLLALSRLDSESLHHIREPLIDLKLLRQLEQQPDALDASLQTTEAQRSVRMRPRVVRLLHGIGARAIHSPIYTTIIVASLVYGVFGYLAWDLRPDNVTTDTGMASVAVISDSADVKWSSDATSPSSKSSIHRGEPLKIESGTMELELNAGTKLVVEGPAEWSIDGQNKVSLRAGKLTAHVPKEAIGFTIETPAATIVDLGTEFGVEVDSSGRANVEVFQGKVDVSYPPVDGSAQAFRRTVRMSAGQAKRFSIGNSTAEATVVDINPRMKNQLAGASPKIGEAESHHDTEARYVAAVMADHPLAYWRLSDGNTGVATDASGHGFNGFYNGSMRSSSGMWPRSRDTCARFLGPESPGWLEMKDVQIPASFTIETWVRSGAPVWNTDGWLLSSRTPNGLMICPISNSRNWQFGACDGAGTDCYVGWHVPDKIDDRFHQYVGTYDAATDHGCMYFDGSLVGESKSLIGGNRSQESRKLTLQIGRDKPSQSTKRYGNGWIDEVAIFPAALSADAVHRHFETYGGIRVPSQAISADVTRSHEKPVHTIWLSNLFDDTSYTPLGLAMATDAYQAEVTPDALGVDRVIIGDARDNTILEIADKIQLDVKKLGWKDHPEGSAVNDAWAKGSHGGPLRLDGTLSPRTGPKIAEGIGMHADSALTFDLDKLRNAGRLSGKSLRFVCDRAGVNDDCRQGTGSIHMAVVLSSQSAVKAIWVDGEPVELGESNGRFEVASAIGKPLVAHGHTFSSNIPLDLDTRFLTLIVAVAGDNADLDHGAWLGARLEASP
jgi:hypothetical protein